MSGTEMIQDPRWLEDRYLIKRTFRETFGRELDLDNPRTLNEKIAYKILFDRRPLLTLISDKIRVRDYVAQKVGPACLKRLYQVCRTSRQIDWQALPPSFVIKANHGSGMNAFVPDKSKADPERLLPTVEGWLDINYYHACRREWSYRDIVPSLLIEELLADAREHVPTDYRFYVFDGLAAYLHVTFDRFSNPRSNFYERNLNRLNVRLLYPNNDGHVVFPENIEDMFVLADRLGHGLDFVRVDLYNIQGRIVFGELTNYPGAGLDRFHPPEYDGIIGARWRLPASYQ
ncbi:MAG TPA: ATP-grasp fold amidoligase family protein [Alphaproteobacteria bacterium]|nr:ATP-grasp fold amidoligase family protein [Alphaproteobacteria bacterium]